MNSIRCCISCILPCGALDVIRIVHSNGRVEEFSRTIRAEEVMKANPKHVLRKPSTYSSSSDNEGDVPKIVIVPPDAELQRGKIYFLMPIASVPEKPRRKSSNMKKKNGQHQQPKQQEEGKENLKKNTTSNGNSIAMTKVLISDRYLTEILSENKASTQRDRRRGRVGVWRPHLESISEIPVDV